MTRLSICIPTYKRSQCLAELLDSILAQGVRDIQVVISDDASPDDTVAVVESYKSKFADLVFIRQPQNIGLDRNFRAVVAAATGEYIWLMGDDDRLEPDAARTVLGALDRWPGVCGLTLGVIDYDVELKHATGIRKMPPTQRIEGIEALFAAAVEHLGFMSALVVKRSMWAAVAAEPSTREYENYYIQLYIIGQIVARHGSWGIVAEPCVGFRTANDQLMARFGWLQRLRIDIVAYDQIAEVLFGEKSPARRAMRNRIFNVHVMARIYNAKSWAGRTPELLKVTALLFERYRDLPAFWTKGLPALATPKWVLRNARVAYQRFMKNSGAARARALALATQEG
jgi:glycosyltransferase involved in cell wall biosynthesis